MTKKVALITILSIIVFVLIFNLVKTKKDVFKEINDEVKNSNILTMMLETEAGTGSYEKVTHSEWPTDGYVFNATLSKCENGGTLAWDDKNKKVIMQTNVSDKCYVYFDKEIPLVSFIVDGTTYYGEKGMTFSEFVNSSYNNGDFSIDDLCIVTYKSTRMRYDAGGAYTPIIRSNYIDFLPEYDLGKYDLTGEDYCSYG